MQHLPGMDMQHLQHIWCFCVPQNVRDLTMLTDRYLEMLLHSTPYRRAKNEYDFLSLISFERT